MEVRVERTWQLRTEGEVLEAIREVAVRMMKGELTPQEAGISTNVLRALLREMLEQGERAD